MTQTSTTTSPTPDASLRDALQNQLLAGPTYPEVATILLRDALKKLYPTLDLDPHTTVVGAPDWDIVEGEILQLATFYAALSEMLADRVLNSDSMLLIEGVHFLTHLPITTPEVHLPVPIDQIGRLINELVPAIVPALQEQQLAYWNASLGTSGPRWHELSRTLRKIWNVQQVEGWTATECGMARRLFQYPDLRNRKNNDPYDTHAYLIDINEVDEDEVKPLNENSIVVLIGTVDNKEVILSYSMSNGYEKYESQQALGQSLPSHLGNLASKKIQWRLYEPDGNIFDQKACGLIDMQVNVIASPGFLEGFTFDENEQPPTNTPNADKGPGEGWFKKQVPDWLQAASKSDQIQFAELMKNLSALGSSHAGKSYLDDIPPIRDYALSALKKQMESEHADASTLDLEKIEIEILSPVIWGSFVVPGKIETTRFSLVELALQNLIALPLGDKAVRSLDGNALPEWMTDEYIEKLITKVDLGRIYPELVKSKLLDDPAESTRREGLYTSQLRIQLPMLALENKIRGQGNIDERGYRYVAALMEPEEADRKVDGQTIVLRKLAFVPELQLGTSEDIVTNMFVIGPQDPGAGPCLLYRPLLEPQLCQYPSSSNLLYAIRQTTSLRQSVLAWLPDGVRAHYRRYIFSDPLPSPWAIVEFTAAPLTTLLDSGPIKLSDTPLGGDFLPLLFKANADALVELADRQSISNSENRWETFKRAGWLIFNLALPYLGNAVGTAAWLWQILDDIEKLTQRSEESDSQAKGEAFVDLLLNMAMAISTHAMERARETGRNRRTKVPEVVHQLESLPKPGPTIKKLAPLTNTTLPSEHYASIHSSGALIGTSPKAAKLLEAFSIDEPEEPGQPKAEGALKGLYEKGDDWYAKVAEKWFKVTVDEDDVSIVHGTDPTRRGPPLMSNAHGQWHIDLRLRLRGGGSKMVRQKVIAEAKSSSTELLAELNRFEETKPQSQRLLATQAQDLNKASGSSRTTKRELYLKTLKTQRESYENALKILNQQPVFQSMPDYARTRLGYLNTQINLTFAEIGTLQERFTPALSKALGMIDPGIAVLEQQHINTAENMISVADDMIERLDYMETRFSRLKKLGLEGFEFIRQHRGNMPGYKSDTLRLIQVEMYRHLCLSLGSINTVPEGWADLGQIIDNATVSLESLHDAINERSVIRLDEQIDALGSLTEQFEAIDEHLEYVSNEYKDIARPAQLTQLREQIGTIKEQALGHLEFALEERSNRRTLASPYEKRPRPRKKFIRARFWGFVSGKPRLSKTGEETDWVDVKYPLSDKIIVTFHRKETGEWVPHGAADAPLAVPALATSVAKGKALINGLVAFKAQIDERIEQPDRTPTGIGMILNAHASRMQKVSLAIKKAIVHAQGVTSNETIEISGQEQRLAESLCMELEKEANALHELGFEKLLEVIKQSPPTMSGVIWLKNRNQILIGKQLNRQRVKGKYHYYLDRYEIKDQKENKTLWFADFHYSTDWVPAHAYLSARLKTPEQVNQAIAIDSTEGLNQRQLISHYSSEIAVDQAKEVFFPKERS